MKIVCNVCEGKGLVLTNNWIEVNCKACDGDGNHDLDKLVEIALAIKWAEQNNVFPDDYGRIAFDYHMQVVEKYREVHNES